jgi:hypothetical protein
MCERAARSTVASKVRLSTRAAHSGHLPSDPLRNAHDGPEVRTHSSGLSHKLKYLFDLNGYLVLRGVFSNDEVEAANTAIDVHIETELHERTGELRTSGLYGRQSAPLKGDGTTGRFDMGGMLGWAKPHCEPFRNVLVHPKIVPVLTDLLGAPHTIHHPHAGM